MRNTPKEGVSIKYFHRVKILDTILEWKRQHKIGQFREVDPEEQKAAEEAKKAKEEAEKAKIASMKVGDR